MLTWLYNALYVVFAIMAPCNRARLFDMDILVFVCVLIAFAFVRKLIVVFEPCSLPFKLVVCVNITTPLINFIISA